MTTTSARDAKTPIGNLVNGPAVVVESTATLDHVAKTLGTLGIGVLVVTENGAVVGVVSERDLVWAIARDAELDEVWAADIMTPDVVMIEPSTTVAEAARMMAAKNARHILVMHGDEPGVVSLRDVIEYLVD